jgi:chromosome segregation ATPase
MRLLLDAPGRFVGMLVLASAMTSTFALASLLAPSMAFAQAGAKSKGPGDKLMSREELRVCFKERDALKAQQGELGRERQTLDGEQGDIKVAREALGKDVDAVAADKDKVDRTDEAAVKAYNARVETTLAVYNAKKPELDARIDGWNARNKALEGRASQHEGAQQSWKDNCGSRRYREDDEKALRAGK